MDYDSWKLSNRDDETVEAVEDERDEDAEYDEAHDFDPEPDYGYLEHRGINGTTGPRALELAGTYLEGATL